MSSSSSPRACRVCGSKSDLYLTGCCRKMVICLECAKSMVLKKELCADCGMLFERVVREYDVRCASSSENKKYILAEYEDAPDFSKNDKLALQKADPTLAMVSEDPKTLIMSSSSSPRECRFCGSKSNMFLIDCCMKTVVCFDYGKSMAEKKELCSYCGIIVEQL